MVQTDKVIAKLKYKCQEPRIVRVILKKPADLHYLISRLITRL